MRKLCLLLLCVSVSSLIGERTLSGQPASVHTINPMPQWEDEYYHQHHFTVGAGMLVSVFPASRGFYFEYVSPNGKELDAVHHMNLAGGGWGPGFIAQSGLDIALGGGFKISAEANLLYQSVAHSEAETSPTGSLNGKNYAMSVWYTGLQLLAKKALTFHSMFVTAGMSVAYYITDVFSGQYLTPQVNYDIQQQTSHYTFNPQQYFALIGVGLLPSHSEERVFSAELLARIPLSSLFYGTTQNDYVTSGVHPSRVWSISLSAKMELPFGRQIAKEKTDDHPADTSAPSDSTLSARQLR